VLAAASLLLAGLPTLAPAAGKGRGKKATVQLRFGVDMAQRGAWKEAQYRFERAAAQAPGDAQVLNNLAVAYENNGRYDDAEATYQKALEAAPDNEKIRANFERFRIFYLSHKESMRRQEPGGESGDEGERDG
jgi:type IV pilus assembly protein PilF